MRSLVRKCRNVNILVVMMAAGLLFFGGYLLYFAEPAAADEAGAIRQEGTCDFGMACIAAAISTGVSCIGAAIAVSLVGSACIGAVAEKPELMGRTTIVTCWAIPCIPPTSPGLVKTG